MTADKIDCVAAARALAAEIDSLTLARLVEPEAGAGSRVSAV